MKREQRVLYWRENLLYLLGLLLVWFAVSYMAGIFLADFLDGLGRIMGFPIGFWFANQGSIIVFVLIIAVYALLMAKLDARYGVYDD